jgi:hypothetical protein
MGDGKGHTSALAASKSNFQTADTHGRSAHLSQKGLNPAPPRVTGPLSLCAHFTPLPHAPGRSRARFGRN